MKRRDFLKSAGALAAASASLTAAPGNVTVAIADEDPNRNAPAVQWAAAQLRSALTEGKVQSEGLTIRLATVSGPAESVNLRRTGNVIVAGGGDANGIKYAALELADRVRFGGSLQIPTPIVETPANRIRSITKFFVSDVEDKPWFNDREMWPHYLPMLAEQRFNRFSLAFGNGYDFLKQITDCYLHFAYPFLIQPKGWNVRANGLPDSERDNNLQLLRFISDQTEARGMHFQLALWTHGYIWADSPHANYIIEGLKPEDHARYCSDALQQILEACPSIRGVTLRIHGESGVQEGDYAFWNTLFKGIKNTGRPIEIDMHAKGIDFEMIDVGLRTELPVMVSPKYWAEHMGLGYHQAGIRELEMPPKGKQDSGFFARSNGSRKFMRYGFGDLLREDRKYGVLHRIWPGTQRILLSGDPALAAAYGRASSFCGSDGIEVSEPLSFKGRKGSGHPGGRCAYADASLKPRWDWQKFEYTYRIWGRLLYNPDADPQVWRRYLNHEFGPSAGAAETSLANASRILPLITTAHTPSAANNIYWPEIYTNMPLVETSKKSPYSDTPDPKKFGTVSPLDTETFAGVDEYAASLLKMQPTGKYSPIDVACWLEQFSAGAKSVPKSRRWDIDVAIQSGVGSFFAAKFRAGVLYSIYEQSGDRAALELALKHYKQARAAWARAAERGKVYVADISAGLENLHGHWADRLPAIDDDLAEMEKLLARTSAQSTEASSGAIREALRLNAQAPADAHHTPPPNFQPGEPLVLKVVAKDAVAVELRYRHVNQAERFISSKEAVIPGDFTASPYPLEYYFAVNRTARDVAPYPGLRPPDWRPPYFVVRQKA
jgi:hypothetical protein